MNAEGETVRRWLGYGGAEHFLEDFQAALDDPTSMDDRLERFAADGSILASHFAARMEPLKALAMYEGLKAISDDPESGFEQEIFKATFMAARYEQASVEELEAAADAALKDEGATLDEKMGVGLYMTYAAGKLGKADLAVPYVRAALGVAEGAQKPLNGDQKGMLNELHVFEALHIERDPERAFELKRASMSPGWGDDVSSLNKLAWWCFENNVALGEGEKLARKGVELAAEDGEKANVLDTLAEVLYLKGDTQGAVEAITQAIELDPENEYWKKQLEKFSAKKL